MFTSSVQTDIPKQGFLSVLALALLQPIMRPLRLWESGALRSFRPGLHFVNEGRARAVSDRGRSWDWTIRTLQEAPDRHCERRAARSRPCAAATRDRNTRDLGSVVRGHRNAGRRKPGAVLVCQASIALDVAVRVAGQSTLSQQSIIRARLACSCSCLWCQSSRCNA